MLARFIARRSTFPHLGPKIGHPAFHLWTPQKTQAVFWDGLAVRRMLPSEDEVKDLIAAAKNAKVFISSFAFLRDNIQHLFKTIPELDLFLVDELHMGYGGPKSKQTESFWLAGRKHAWKIGPLTMER